MNMKLTFEELSLVTPFIQMDILAGWGGKETTFYAIVPELEARKMTSACVALVDVAEVHSRKLNTMLGLEHITGIIIFGNGKTSLTTETKNIADDLKKPVFILRDVSNFDIMKSLTEIMLLKEKNLFHILIERSSNYWLQLLTNEGILRVFQQLRMLTSNPMVVLDPQFQLYEHQDVDPSDWGEIPFIKREYYKEEERREMPYSLFTYEERNLMLFQLSVGKQRYGFLLVKEEVSFLTSVSIDIILHAIPTFVTAIKYETELIAERNEYKHNFIYDLLHNNVENTRTLIKQGNLWGLDFTKPTQLMVMKLELEGDQYLSEPLNKRIKLQISATISKHFLKAEVTELNEQFVIIVFDSQERTEKDRLKFMKGLAEELKAMMKDWLPNIKVTIGLGKAYASNIDLFRSYQEAKTALEMGKYTSDAGVLHFNEIGIMRLLASVQTDILVSYYKEHLSELLAHDEATNSDLFQTLQMYYQKDGDISTTAECLYIHPNTLRNRIKKIESLLDVDLSRYEDLVNVYVILKIYTMFKR